MSFRARRFLELMQASDDLVALGEKLERLGIRDAEPLIRNLVELTVMEANAVQTDAYSEMDHVSGDAVPTFN